MKKLFLLFSLFALIVQSCEKSDIQEQAQTVDLAKIQNLKSMKPEMQKVAFNLLNEKEKSKLWNDRIDFILNSGELNKVQTSSIKSLRILVKPDFFNADKNTSLKEDIKDWIIINEKNFERDNFIVYFTTLNDISTLQKRDVLMHNDDGGGGGNVPDDCECNKLEDYCLGSDYECKNSTCQSKMTSCGFFWNSKCNGECLLK